MCARRAGAAVCGHAHSQHCRNECVLFAFPLCNLSYPDSMASCGGLRGSQSVACPPGTCWRVRQIKCGLTCRPCARPFSVSAVHPDGTLQTARAREESPALAERVMFAFPLIGLSSPDAVRQPRALSTLVAGGSSETSMLPKMLQHWCDGLPPLHVPLVCYLSRCMWHHGRESAREAAPMPY